MTAELAHEINTQNLAIENQFLEERGEELRAFNAVQDLGGLGVLTATLVVQPVVLRTSVQAGKLQH